MRKKFPIRLVLVPAIIGLIAWWLWPLAQQGNLTEQSKSSLGGRGLVSAVQPVGSATSSGEAFASGNYSAIPATVLSDSAKQELSSQFRKAQQAFEQGNQSRAIEILSQLTIDHPNIIEPYVNLAAAYAADGQLEESRLTLTRAVDVNKTYARLFENLQKIHGALAANAYRSALDQEEQLISKVELPTLEQVSLFPSGEQMVALMQQREGEFRQQLADVSQELELNRAELEMAKSQNSDAAETSDLVASLQSQLAQSRQEVSDLRNGGLAVAAISSQPASDKPASDSATAQSVDLARQEQVREQELLDQQQRAERELAAKKLADQEQARLAELAKVKEQEKALAAAKVREQQAQAASEQTGNRQQAVQLVQSWAGAWSQQNVEMYVGHYKSGYTPPGSSITHSTWLQQRQVRLTNKKFINVDVSDFEVVDAGDKFFVTFTQHYRSNTMDDTIRKQLQFQKSGTNWSQAKIIGERVVR